MSTKLIVAMSITMGLLAPFLSNAAESTAAPAVTTPAAPAGNTVTEMTKDSWLKAMTPMLPDLICKGFIQDAGLKKRLDEIKMTYEQCVAKIPESATKCQSQIYANIPEKINSESAGVWGKNLGECIGKDFAEKYLVKK